jgi:alcohol dehydrogenase
MIEVRNVDSYEWMGLQKSFPFLLPGRIQFGPGVAQTIGQEATSFGQSVMVVTDQGVRGAGLIEPIVSELERAGLECSVFAEVEANPRIATVEKAAAAAKEHGAEMLVAVGGGSVIDTAKVVSAIVSHGGGVLEYEGYDRVPGPVIPLIALPTTSGTGSEVTFWAVVTDVSRSYKLAVSSVLLAPRVALVDPLLTKSLPPTVTAGTGLDALSHAIEAYTARCSNPISDALALYAIELVALNLERAVHDGADVEARCGMALASLIAGISFGNADTSAAHAMAEALGGVFDTPHGLACAVCLPYMTRFNLPAVTVKTARIGQALGLPTAKLPLEEAAEATIEGLVALGKRVGIPTMRSFGVTEADIPLLVSIALLNVGNADNPADVDEAVFSSLFKEALVQD